MKDRGIIWPDFPTHSNISHTLISPDSLTTFLDRDVGKITKIQRVNGKSRNPVYRLYTDDTNCQIIAKWYLPWLDRFYDSRFRREEKVLSLLNRWFRNQVPEVYGGIITGQFAILVEQNVGERSLDYILQEAGSEEQRHELVSHAVELLADFHRICQEHYSIFYRTCQSADLDRLNKGTYIRRARIAIGRLLLLQAVLEENKSAEKAYRSSVSSLEELTSNRLNERFFKLYYEQVVLPLIKAPRQILHNSFSPFHLIWNGHLSLVDFETMSVGAAQVDLAELLAAPEIALSPEKQLTLVKSYYERASNKERRENWHEFVDNFHRAFITRSLDYAGTTAYRCAKCLAEGNEKKAASNLSRARHYLLNVVDGLKSSEVADFLNDFPQI